jgi:glycosyltransferase involved in cell wall biosynthesis
MMGKPNYKFAVSVIVPTYNRSKLLSYTLDSLVRQNISKGVFEVIIGDDGSSDDTNVMLQQYEGLINLKYVYQEDKGYRPGSARNNAIMLAEGRICLFVDSSVILHPDCIQEHIRFHDRQEYPVSAIGYVYGFDHNEESEDKLKQLVLPTDAAASITRLAKFPVFHDVREEHYIKYDDKIETLPAPWFYFWTCHLSIAKKDLDNVGVFDEGYDGRWGVEDNDLGFRLHLYGVNICLLRSALSIHFPHGKDKAERREEGYQNCLYFHNKFNTLETKLFLDHYNSPSLDDINDISIKTWAARGGYDSL